MRAATSLDGEALEYPVRVVPGEEGTTVLSENVEPLPPERYRVEKYSIADPADVDGDCIDDITELNDHGAHEPVEPPSPAIDPSQWFALAIPDHVKHSRRSRLSGPQIRHFSHVKYTIVQRESDRSP